MFSTMVQAPRLGRELAARVELARAVSDSAERAARREAERQFTDPHNGEFVASLSQWISHEVD